MRLPEFQNNLLPQCCILNVELRTLLSIIDEWKTKLMSLAILFHFLCAQHASDINISIFRSLRLCWWITTSVFLFSVRCVLEFLLRLIFGVVRFGGWSRLLKMAILMSETCWAHNKWNKIASDIKLVFHSSTINWVVWLYMVYIYDSVPVLICLALFQVPWQRRPWISKAFFF